jgi:uncharacterized membrane protein YtjA (UPF0391 family)
MSATGHAAGANAVFPVAAVPTSASQARQRKEESYFVQGRLVFPTRTLKKGTKAMLSYAITFLIIAIIAGLFGFTGIAGTAGWIAQILFVIFLILFVVSLVTGRRPPAA